MNLFIWEINVIGNDKIDTNTIIKSAEKTGLVTGTLSKKHFTCCINGSKIDKDTFAYLP